jgi:hypothetical protein
MRLLKLFIAGTCTALLVACAAPANKTFAPPTDFVPNNQIVITSKFKLITISKDNFFYEANKCVQSYNPDATAVRKTLEKFPSNDILGVGHVRSSKTFILYQTRGFCLERSAANFPIFAAEAIDKTVNPIGASPAITDNWYKQIAMLIATKGIAKIAYTFSNGNAFIATYWVESTKTTSLQYSSEFKKAGTWEKEVFDRKFSHPTATSVTETKRGDQLIKHVLFEDGYPVTSTPNLTAAQFIAQSIPTTPTTNVPAPKLVSETNGNITNTRAEGSLASNNNIGCIEISNVKNQYTPADMYKGVAVCMEQGNYEWAYKLYAMAGLYAKFDAERITDETARQASTVLIINTMSPIAKEKRDKLMEVQSVILKSPQELSKLCQQVQKVGMPNYYPSYMIFHGVKAFMGNPNIGALKENLDLNVVWKDSQKSYLKCDI